MKKFLLVLIVGLLGIGVYAKFQNSNDTVVYAKVSHKVAAKRKVLNKKAQAKYKELTTGDDSYSLASKVKLEYRAKTAKINGINLWCDESLANADSTELRHYFSLAGQIGSAAKGGYELPFVKVYAGDVIVTRSTLENTNKSVDTK